MTSTHAVGAVGGFQRAEGGPCRHARSAGHRHSADRARRGDEDRALRRRRREGLSVHRRWGEETDTDDAEGAASQHVDERPRSPISRRVLPRFIGEIMQTPPDFSAIKIDGDRAYDLAREGETVALEPRGRDRRPARHRHARRATTVFEAECGKGTYVRALARDIGRALGCFGHVIGLRRTRVGPFHEGETSVGLAGAARGGDGFWAALASRRGGAAGPARVNVRPKRCGKFGARAVGAGARARCAEVLSGAAYAHFKGRTPWRWGSWTRAPSARPVFSTSASPADASRAGGASISATRGRRKTLEGF